MTSLRLVSGSTFVYQLFGTHGTQQATLVLSLLVTLGQEMKPDCVYWTYPKKTHILFPNCGAPLNPAFLASLHNPSITSDHFRYKLWNHHCSVKQFGLDLAALYWLSPTSSRQRRCHVYDCLYRKIRFCARLIAYTRPMLTVRRSCWTVCSQFCLRGLFKLVLANYADWPTISGVTRNLRSMQIIYPSRGLPPYLRAFSVLLPLSTFDVAANLAGEPAGPPGMCQAAGQPSPPLSV